MVELFAQQTASYDDRLAAFVPNSGGILERTIDVFLAEHGGLKIFVEGFLEPFEIFHGGNEDFSTLKLTGTDQTRPIDRTRVFRKLAKLGIAKSSLG